MIHRFVGDWANVGGVVLDHIGQAFEGDPIEAGVRTIPDEDFQNIFTDPKELEEFALIHARQAAPESFHAKLREAWKLVGKPPQIEASTQEIVEEAK